MRTTCILTSLLLCLFILSCEEDYQGIYDDYEATTEDGDKYTDYGENPFLNAADYPLSTFSIDADGASFANMRRYLMNGSLPPASSVRIEEYINYFTFDYTAPQEQYIAINSDMATCPWSEGHYLLRLGIKGKEYKESELPYSNYVFLVDVSGSMSANNKLPLLKKGLKLLVDNLRDYDRISIVTYSGSVKVLLESTYLEDREAIKNTIDKLDASGSTAGGEAIQMAYTIATENFIPGGNNRIILGTDGDFNVGISSTSELVELVKEKRENGVYLTVLGFGSGNLNDDMMEQLADNGNGNYEYIDSEIGMKKVFIDEVEKLFTVAKDCKVQVRFDSNMVDRYRLIGYENRVLDNEEYNNDSVDAGEIGAGQTITAVYELILKENAVAGQYAVFTARYKKPTGTVSIILKEAIDVAPVALENASENMRFAAGVTAFGLLMKQSEYAGTVDREMVLNLINNAHTFDSNGYRQDFVDLLEGYYSEE